MQLTSWEVKQSKTCCFFPVQTQDALLTQRSSCNHWNCAQQGQTWPREHCKWACSSCPESSCINSLCRNSQSLDKVEQSPGERNKNRFTYITFFVHYMKTATKLTWIQYFRKNDIHKRHVAKQNATFQCPKVLYSYGKLHNILPLTK